MAAVPADIARELRGLRRAVTAVVPAKSMGNVLIATWNLRAFGGLTPKWRAGDSDSPKRDQRAIALIAEVVSHFDVIALQEVKRSTTALRYLLECLGPSWRFITSDVSEGSGGNDERLAYIFDTSRVVPSGLVGEIVLPPVAGEPARQFARTPYAASFARHGIEFILTTLHIVWGASPKERLPELAGLAEWMRKWATRANDWNQNLLVLGDFNIDRIDDPLFAAFVSTGLWPPAELNDIPRTIFDNDRNRHFYDQIAWFGEMKDNGSIENLLRGIEYRNRAGSFDFVPHAFAGLDKNALSWRISDHYPLWAEFHLI